MAREISSQYGLKCVALCYCGVVHGYVGESDKTHAPPANGLSAAHSQSRIEPIIQRYAPELLESGGDWRSRHIALQPPSPIEAVWIELLEREFAL
jgi:hypothetical protein